MGENTKTMDKNFEFNKLEKCFTRSIKWRNEFEIQKSVLTLQVRLFKTKKKGIERWEQ